MQPRHLGIRVILVKSFARIHETNLKKQGMLALTFSNEADYDKIQEDDTIDIIDLTSFAPEKQLTLALNHRDGGTETIKVNHTYNSGQIEWFKAGSALNLMAQQINMLAKAIAKSPAKEVAKKTVAAKAPAKKTKTVVAKKVVKKASLGKHKESCSKEGRSQKSSKESSGKESRTKESG